MFYADGTACALAVRISLFPVASALPRPFSNTQLTANIQTVAGIVSLIHDYRISERMQPLGFLNYLLYADEVKGITDVISGGNPGCDTVGFLAAEGWDPVRPAALFRVIFGVG